MGREGDPVIGTPEGPGAIVIEPVGPSRPVGGSRRLGRVGLARPGAVGGTDSVELSGLGRLLAKMEATSPLREAKLETVRDEVAGGRYATPERVEAALENLAAEIDDLSA